MARLADMVQKLRLTMETDGVDAAATQLEHLVRATDNAGKSAGRAGNQLEAMTRAADPLYKATQQLERIQRAINTQMEKGVPISDANLRALKNYQDQVAKFSNDNNKLNKLQLLTIQQTAGDVAASLATGQSPLRILMQQGEQFLQPFGTGLEGAKNAASRLIPAIAGLINPISVVGAAVATTAYEFAKWNQNVDSLITSLNGLGRNSGQTVASMAQIARAGGAQGSMSTNTAFGVAGQMLTAGVSGSNIQAGIGATGQLSRMLGMTVDETAKILSQALAEPAKGAEELSRKYGLVSFAQQEEIKQLDAVGNRTQATAKLLDVLTNSMKNMEDPTWTVTKFFQDWGQKISNNLTRLGSNADLLRRYARQQMGGESIAAEDQRRKDTAGWNFLQGQLSDTQRRNKELNDIRATNEMAVREISARTFAEREAIATERARVETMRSTNDAVKAGIAAEAERAKLIAESNKALDDYNRTSSDNLKMSGMTAYERATQQALNQDRDLRQRYVSGAATGKTVITIDAAREAIAAMESRGSGGYSAIGPLTNKGDRAYGRYQVMGNNIPSWTKEVLGKSLSIKEFLGNNAAQDAVFNSKFMQAANKYGSMSEAASVWFTGQPSSVSGKRKDVLGTSGNAYTSKFSSIVGKGSPVLSGDLLPGTKDNLSSINKEFIDTFLRQGNEDLDRQIKLLETQSLSFGKSTEEITKAAKAQELVNHFSEQHIPITNEMQAAITGLASRYGEFVSKSEEMARSQQNIVEMLGNVRSTASETMSGLASAFLDGKSAVDVLEQSLRRLTDRLLDFSINKGLDALMGQQGKPGGLLSGLISGTSGGGLFGSLFGALPKFADGGTLGAGKIGIAGENGPELIAGPANVFPIAQGKSGKANVVINNYAGADVSAQQTDDGKIVVMIQQALNQYSKRVPGIVAEAQRRAI